MNDQARRPARLPPPSTPARSRRAPAVYNSTKGKKSGSDASSALHANKKEEIEPSPPADIGRGIGLKLPPPATPSAIPTSDRARVDDVSRAVIAGRDRAEDRAPDDEKLGVSMSRSGPRGSTFKVTSEEETGLTLIHGWASWPPRIIRRPPAARKFRVDAQRRQAPGGLPRTIRKPAAAQGRYVRQTGAAASTGRPPRGGARDHPARGFRSKTRSSAARSRGSSFPRSRRACAGARERGAGPGTPWWMSGSPGGRLPTTRWTRRRWPFKIAASMAFKEAARRGQACAPRAP